MAKSKNKNSQVTIDLGQKNRELSILHTVGLIDIKKQRIPPNVQSNYYRKI